MRLIRMAFSDSPGSSFALTSAVFNSLPVNEGSSWGANVVVSGGTAPYVYKLVVDGVLQYSTTTSSTSSFVGGSSIVGWNGKAATIEVTDANGTGTTVTSSGQMVSVQWIRTPTISLSSYSPAVGQFVSCSATTDANPAPSYQWYYQYKPAGGSWGASTPWGGNAAMVYSGAFITAGDQWYFSCTETNAVGSANGSSALLTVT